MADAAPVAPPAVDAAVAAASGSGSAVDPKLAAIPEGGILLATVSKEQLVVAKLDRGGVKVLHRLPFSELGAFAWLDATTLAVKEPNGKTDKPVVMKVVDGKPTETVELGAEWELASMLVTKTGEVWLERCTVEPEGPDPCTKLAYQRVWPSKKLVTKKPAGVDGERVGAGSWARGIQGPAATVAGPADVELDKVKLTAKDETGSQKIVGIKCTKGGRSATHPDLADYDTAYGYTAKSARWVLAEPAVYEITADAENPVGQIETDVEYFIACQPKPLDGFISLGGPLWGEYKDADLAGTWTFRVGTTDVGTLDGTVLRANR